MENKLKLNSSKSQFQKETDSRSFEEKASEIIQTEEERKKRIADLVLKFWSLTKDKTLDSQKGPLRKNLELEIISGLINISQEMNNDLNDKNEGTGSIGLSQLLLKSIFYLKGELNEALYRINLLEKEINERKPKS